MQCAWIGLIRLGNWFEEVLITFTGISKLFGRIISHTTQLIKSEFRNLFLIHINFLWKKILLKANLIKDAFREYFSCRCSITFLILSVCEKVSFNFRSGFPLEI